jgi:hypothetical protein
LLSLEEKLALVEKNFRRTSKSYDAARYIVRQQREIDDDEKEAICSEFGIAYKTLSYIFTRLKKLKLYGIIQDEQVKQKAALSKEPIIEVETEPEPSKETQEIQEAQHTPQYVSRQDFEIFQKNIANSINALTALLNNDELEPITEEEDYVTEDPPIMEAPGHAILEEATMKQMGTWIKAKNLLYYDFARQGYFRGALEDFEGNWSDFVNTVIEDYFKTVNNVGIGILSRRFA